VTAHEIDLAVDAIGHGIVEVCSRLETIVPRTVNKG